jgi:hypothetical protein
MSQTRNKTLIQHLGFADPDLKSPGHDALVLWIAENIPAYIANDRDPWKNLPEAIQTSKTAIERQWEREHEDVARFSRNVASYTTRQQAETPTPSYILEALRESHADLETAQGKIAALAKLRGIDLPVPTEAPLPKVTAKFEMPITTERDYIVGFVDVVATVCYPYLDVTQVRCDYYNNGRDIKILGLTGVAPEITFELGSEHVLYFEAKPNIPSMGELLRQIRTYQTYAPKEYRHPARFVVVSPDTRFRKAIESQGIEFWECPAL